MSIGNQNVDLKKLKESEELVKKIMDDMNEKELIFFSTTIHNYVNLKLLEKK